MITKVQEGRLGLPYSLAKQTVAWSQSSMDGAELDRQRDPTNGLSVERMVRLGIARNAHILCVSCIIHSMYHTQRV